MNVEREDALFWYHKYKNSDGRTLEDSDEFGEENLIMELTKAKGIADGLVDRLAPYCERIEVAGSVRRERPSVGDIEIVCIPKMVEVPDTFFDTKIEKHAGFIEAVDSFEKLKGDARDGKYMQRFIKEYNIKLDIFTATRTNWGLIFAIRTGSAEFSHRVLATGWKKKGFTSINGNLRNDLGRVPVYEEIDLFKLIGIEWVPPKEREL